LRARNTRRRLAPKLPEERLQEGACFSFTNTSGYWKRMIKPLCPHNVELGATGTRLRIPTTVHQGLNTAQYGRPYTHNTRLKCDIQGGSVKSPTRQALGGMAQGHNLRVRRGIARRLALIVAAGNDHPINHDHSANRDVRAL
jgi:hypothetical protein